MELLFQALRAPKLFAERQPHGKAVHLDQRKACAVC